MSRRLNREFYLLPRGEQRALILLSLLLILSLLFRIAVGLLPDPEPGWMEEFEKEARLVLASVNRADSLQELRSDSMKRSPANIPLPAERYPDAYKEEIQSGPIDINRADSAQLLLLPGIGPVFAGRIVKYRNLLGGFTSVEQLGEVYGLTLEKLEIIRDRIDIDTSAIRKIQLNSASFRELLRHPYLEFEHVKALVGYRDFKGYITSLKELQINQILPDSTLNRIDGYFDYR